MKVNGRHTFAASREVVWSALYDATSLERILPGCESLESLSANEHRVELRLRLGQVVDRFSGTLRLDHVIPFTGFDFAAEGESPSGRIDGHGRVYLEDTAEGHTSLCYEAEFDVAGPIALGTDRMLQTTARAFARRSLEGLEREIDLRTRVYTTSVAPPPPPVAAADTPRRAALLALLVLAALFFWRLLGQRRAQPIEGEAPAVNPFQPSPASDAERL